MRRIKKWYEHQLEGEVDTIKCNHVVWVRKSVVVEKESKRGIIIILWLYILLHHGIRKVLNIYISGSEERDWKTMRKEILGSSTGSFWYTLSSISKKLDACLEELKTSIRKKTALLGKAKKLLHGKLMETE